MKTPKHLFTAHDIAAAIGRNYTATIAFLKEHNIKPVREVKTENRVFRQYSKSAMNQAITIADQTLTRRKKKEAPLPYVPPASVQTNLPFEPAAGVDIDKAHTQAPAAEPTPPIKPNIDITVIETKHAEEMLAVLRLIDEKLGKLLAVWEK